MSENSKLSTESYKGVRDFYPAAWALEKYIFAHMSAVAERFGYEEYNASVLEPAELYRAKTGEEIINEQTYTFTDRGGREVTLRPEMTPTVARMIAARLRELPRPIRWYSIPNLFRYEKPQRGRLREHFQLNVDIFGVDSIQAEVEIILVASSLLESLGLKASQYEIHINSRKIMNYILHDLLELSLSDAQTLSKLIDKKEKITSEEFDLGVKNILGDKDAHFTLLMNTKNFEEFVSHLPERAKAHEGIVEVQTLMRSLEEAHVTNVVFRQTLMRGFDYYTGIVFEVYDTNPKNRRSIFGGGRFDDLLSLFGDEKLSGVGFGAGDVVIADLLETYDLLPPLPPPADVALVLVAPENAHFAQNFAQKLRKDGLKVSIDFTGRKVGDQIKAADKRTVPFLIVIGEEEIKTGLFTIRELKNGEDRSLKEDEVAKHIQSKRQRV